MATAKTTSYRRTFDLSVYADPRFAALPPQPASPRTLWLELNHGQLSGHVPGIVVGGVAWMAETLGWSLRAAQACLAAIVEAQLVRHDQVARVTWIPGRVGYVPPPPSSKNLRGWLACLDGIPDCELKREFVAELARAMAVVEEPRGSSFVTIIRERYPEAAPDAASDAASHAAPDAEGEGEGGDTSPVAPSGGGGTRRRRRARVEPIPLPPRPPRAGDFAPRACSACGIVVAHRFDGSTWRPSQEEPTRHDCPAKRVCACGEPVTLLWTEAHGWAWPVEHEGHLEVARSTA